MRLVGMSDRTEKWAERKLGRKMIRTEDGGGYLFTDAELRKLTEPPSRWWLIGCLLGGVVVAQTAVFFLR